MTSLSDEIKSYGTFLANFLNCKLHPADISSIVNECLSIMERYLGYNNPRWKEVQINSPFTFQELVSKTEHGFFRELIAPYFRCNALGGFHPKKDFIFSKQRKEAIRRAFRKGSESLMYNRRDEIKQIHPDFYFYIEFALLRKNFRKVATRIISGDTLEKIQYDDVLGDFLLRLKSEYIDLNQQIDIRGNQVKIAPLIKDVPNNSYSANSFLDGYLIPCLSYCFMFCPQNENTLQRIKKCHRCDKFYVSKTNHPSRFCTTRCRLAFHNRKRIESGEHARYKRERIASGKATPSYFGPDPDKGKRKT